jgi:hypothetical protein
MDLERYRHAEIGAESRFGLVLGNGGSLAPEFTHQSCSTVNHLPSDPVTQLPQTSTVCMPHDNHAGLSVLGSVCGFVTRVATDLDVAARKGSPGPIEDQSALYLVATRALECMLLIAWDRQGVLPSHLHQVHFHPAYHAAHRTFSLHDEDCSLEAVKMASVGRESDLLGRGQLFSGQVTTHRLKSGVQDTEFRRASAEPTVESDHPRHGEKY